MLQVATGVIVSAVLLIPPIALAGWVTAAQRLRRGEPIMRYEPRRWVSWGVIDLALICCAILTLQLAAVGVLRFAFDIPMGTLAGNDGSGNDGGGGASLEHRATAIVVLGVANLLALAAAIAIVRLRTRADAADLGVNVGASARDLGRGFVAFAMVAVPVLLIQLALTQVFPTRHPLIEMLLKDPDPRLFLAAGFTAVLVAPIAEEYLFRVFIQGWLENFFCLFQRPTPALPTVRDEDAGRLVLGGARPEVAEVVQEWETGAESSGPSLRSDPATQATDPATLAAATGPVPCVWPIVISSFLFAGMHLGNGPDPIPLFFLALGLGYVYQRTHRVLPCIVMHTLLNALSLLQLWVLVPRPAG